MKYREAYDYGVTCLKNSEVPEAELNVRILLEEICKTSRHDLFIRPERIVTEEEWNIYAGFLAKRQKRVPLQYILGRQEFMGLSFHVSADVLIPRQDTEVLVEEVMRYLQDGMRILDMCTGSGCILLSLLHYSNHCSGVGVDISAKALAVAKKNAQTLGIDAAFMESNLFEKVTGTYDVIVSNPPYIAPNIIETLMPEVKDFEPGIALDGGRDGYDFYRTIIKEARNFLSGGGMLFFEIGYEQAKIVSSLMQEEGYRNIKVVKDFAGNDRVVLGIDNKNEQNI